jgi:hypothetical protein
MPVRARRLCVTDQLGAFHVQEHSGHAFASRKAARSRTGSTTGMSTKSGLAGRPGAHVQVHCDVDVDDVALDERPRVGDAVADALVHRRAHALREIACARDAGLARAVDRAWLSVPDARRAAGAGALSRSLAHEPVTAQAARQHGGMQALLASLAMQCRRSSGLAGGAGLTGRTVCQGRGVGAVVHNHLVHGLVYGVRRHARLRARATLTSTAAAVHVWHASGSLAAVSKPRRAHNSARQARARAHPHERAGKLQHPRGERAGRAHLHQALRRAPRASAPLRAPAGGARSVPGPAASHLGQHTCSLPAIYSQAEQSIQRGGSGRNQNVLWRGMGAHVSPRLSLRPHSLARTLAEHPLYTRAEKTLQRRGSGGKPTELWREMGAHLRVMNLHLVVERIFAGIHIRRPHDVLRHRQPRRHGVRPQLRARRAGSARARAP